MYFLPCATLYHVLHSIVKLLVLRSPSKTECSWLMSRGDLLTRKQLSKPIQAKSRQAMLTNTVSGQEVRIYQFQF